MALPATKDEIAEFRDERGRMLPGAPALNPGGRPQKDRKIERLAKAHTQEAVATLAEIMRNGKRDADRREAAKVLLSYAWGKPRQQVDVEGRIDLCELHLLAVRELSNAAPR